VTTAVLGAHGLLGSAIARHLNALTLGRRAPADRIVDLAHPGIDLTGIDALVHAAGVVDEDFSDPPRAFRQAIDGTNALVAAARAAGVKRLCYISSAHVYGPFTGRIDENAPPDPRSDYAIAHFATEQILRRAAADDFRVLILRPCAVFGLPPQNFRRWSLVPFEFPRQAVETGRIALRSHGLQRRNFVGTGDVARVIAAWLARDTAVFERINPIGARTGTVLALARTCAREFEALTGRACPVIAPAADPAFQDEFVYASTVDQPAPMDSLAATLRAVMASLLEGRMP
jgi:UDP-glucose 4-epimerase